MLRFLVKAAVVCGLLVVAGPASAATSTTTSVSTNWSGYVVAGAAPFTSVSATWTQPSVTCTPGRSSSSAFWVGLGGRSRGSNALEQMGTDADCDANGNANYSTWYEVLPAASVPLSVAVAPGDTITASVTVTGTTVDFALQNVTQGTSATKQVTAAAVDTSSAEWIAEAPSLCNRGLSSCRTQPLANFGSVAFSAASATAGGHTGTISDSAWSAEQISLRSGGSEFSRWRGAAAVAGTGAVPGDLSADGSSFTVAVDATAPTPSASPAPATTPVSPRLPRRPGWGRRFRWR